MSTFTGVTGIGHNNNKPYQGDALASLGLGLAHITNSVIIRHSCVVLRRQCQVNDHALRKHLSPVTLIPVIFKLSAKDGFFSLWKGAVGNGVLWAFSRVSELVIAEVFGLPKSFVPDGSSERFWRHVLLKASNFMFCTPVIVSSFIETVRSGAGLTDDLQILEVIVRGFERLQQDFFGGGGPVADRRRHSIFWLAFPTSFYQTVHFLICRYVYTKAFTWTKTYVSRKMPSERKRYHKIMPELYSTMTAFLVADLACYPLETVLHRLYIQGTRTLVDNLDYGTNAFVPAARYTGLVDCFTSIVRNESFWALFSGVGAVFLQYALQHCFSALVYWALEREFFAGSRGYTSGPLRVKTATSLLPGEQSGSGGGDFTPFKSSSQYPHNPSTQFAKSSSQQTSASILMADQGPSNGNNNGQYQQQENNPFFAAALRHQRSTGASNNPYAPDWGDDDDSRKQ